MQWCLPVFDPWSATNQNMIEAQRRALSRAEEWVHPGDAGDRPGARLRDAAAAAPTDPLGGGDGVMRRHDSRAASNAPPIACLLLPARTASPMTVTLCPGLANRLKRSAVPRRAR